MKSCLCVLIAVWVVCTLAACGRATLPATRLVGPDSPAACTPTDQDRYVYDPTRLTVAQACLLVTGVVDHVETETDGDTNIFLRLDGRYRYLLTPANVDEEGGDLVIETVCSVQSVQPNAIQLCASDPDPYLGPFPTAGARVWIEGRYVLDEHHDGHAELHPLYRWGAGSMSAG